MMSIFQQISDKLFSSVDEREKSILAIGMWTGWASVLVLSSFAILFLIYGLYLPGFILLAWGMFYAILAFIVIRAQRKISWLTALHNFTMPTVPFIVDYLLGGFTRLSYPSWIILAIVSANLFDYERIIFWAALSSLMLLSSILIDPTITINPLLPQWLEQVWTSGTTVWSLWVTALAFSYFIRQHDHAVKLLAVERDKLLQMATSDPLTGPYNRRYFYEQGEQTHLLSIRYQHPYSVLMIDLDNFKRVNDTYSHAAGDEVLRESACRLRGNIRTVDTLGRYGGEEFTILLPETNLLEAEQTAKRLLENLRSTPINVGPAELTITASIGVAQSDPSTSEPFSHVVERADQAHYCAKGLGKNCVVNAQG